MNVRCFILLFQMWKVCVLYFPSHGSNDFRYRCKVNDACADVIFIFRQNLFKFHFSILV